VSSGEVCSTKVVPLPVVDAAVAAPVPLKYGTPVIVPASPVPPY